MACFVAGSKEYLQKETISGYWLYKVSINMIQLKGVNFLAFLYIYALGDGTFKGLNSLRYKLKVH